MRVALSGSVLQILSSTLYRLTHVRRVTQGVRGSHGTFRGRQGKSGPASWLPDNPLRSILRSNHLFGCKVRICFGQPPQIALPTVHLTFSLLDISLTTFCLQATGYIKDGQVKEPHGP